MGSEKAGCMPNLWPAWFDSESELTDRQPFPENMGVAVTAADALAALGVHVFPNSSCKEQRLGSKLSLR